MPSHTHSIQRETNNASSGSGAIAGWAINGGPSGQTSFQSTSSGSGDAHNNIQPSLTFNYIVKA